MQTGASSGRCIHQSYKAKLGKRKDFTGQGSPEDLVSPTFRSYATKKNRDELELLQARQKVRELRGSPHAVQEEVPADALEALPLKAAKAKAKQKAGGGRGQGDG